MAIGRRESLCSVSGIVLICLSILTVVGLVGGPEALGKLSFHLKTNIVPYFSVLAWLMPVLGVYWGWKLIVGGPYMRGISFSAFVLMAYFTLSTFSYVALPADAAGSENLGGKLGHLCAGYLVEFFGPVGGGIAVVAGLVVLFLVMTGLSVRSGALWLEEGLRGLAGRFSSGSETPPKRSRPKVARQPASRRPESPRAEDREEPVEEKIITPPSPKVLSRPAEPQPSLGLHAPQRTTDGSDYKCPPLAIFEESKSDVVVPEEELRDLASYLEEKLSRFDIEAHVVEIHPGPVITRFEIEPGVSTKVHQVVNLADDLALALKAKSLRIIAPIPGKGTIGIEVPNKHPSTVSIKEILSSDRFAGSPSKLELALGKDVAGNPYTADLEVMPHLLIAGATGSGKSVCINTIITSLVYKNSPQDVQLLLIDPKRLELNQYEGIPHLVCEVVTEAKKAVRALSWVVEEMDMRYQILAKRGVRNIQAYGEGLPYIVVVIDELADLMLMVPQEIETAVTKLAQMARAVGIHLVVATQRPLVDVITGVIKANFPCRFAFKVASKTDSRTIIDANGAQQLLGKGDMLLLPPGSSEPIRVHGAFVSSKETKRMVEFLKEQSHLACPAFSLDTVEHREVPVDQRDDLFEDAARIVITHQQGSVSLLQRRLKVGYSRAARLIDFLEEAGIVGPFEGSKARQVLVDESYLENLSGKL
ncbi:MAG: DNA translocase FtsK 4TM domain-containing protein [Candidatus Eisenbacteria bacterium]